jgi:hypothetical protein
MTLIEIKPHRNGWKVFEAPGVEPVFPEKRQAINYAENRASFRSGGISVLDCNREDGKSGCDHRNEPATMTVRQGCTWIVNK